MRNEFQFIEHLKRLIPRTLQGPFPLGDDAAILPLNRQTSLLFTTDVIVEGVDFKAGRGGARPEEIGRKALAVSLSDIAAMGGEPKAFVAAFGIPRRFSENFMKRVVRGMISLARQFNTPYVGGDLSRSSRFFISLALLGEQKTKKVIQRNGARPGDFIYVTGELGGSLLGKHLSFTPRVREALFLAEKFSPSSMIDISDGLVQDLEHLLTASKVAAQIELSQIPVSAAARSKAGLSLPYLSLPRQNRRKALEFALSDGEDFELLFTLPSKKGKTLENAWARKFPRLRLTRVGKVQGGTGKIEWSAQGKRTRLWFRKKGFVHF